MAVNSAMRVAIGSLRLCPASAHIRINACSTPALAADQALSARISWRGTCAFPISGDLVAQSIFVPTRFIAASSAFRDVPSTTAATDVAIGQVLLPAATDIGPYSRGPGRLIRNVQAAGICCGSITTEWLPVPIIPITSQVSSIRARSTGTSAQRALRISQGKVHATCGENDFSPMVQQAGLADAYQPCI